MADIRVTKMVMKVDLQCSKCFMKIKKVLCRYPQIRDQMYDEKQNTVTITVVGCCPEMIKEKIACKGGDTVRCIEIVLDKPDKSAKPKPDKSAKPKPDEPKVVCCCCYEGWPCYHGRVPMCYDGCGRPVYECSGGKWGYCMTRCKCSGGNWCCMTWCNE